LAVDSSKRASIAAISAFRCGPIRSTSGGDKNAGVGAGFASFTLSKAAIKESGADLAATAFARSSKLARDGVVGEGRAGKESLVSISGRVKDELIEELVGPCIVFNLL
jgi:hypothetical protein